MANMFRLLRAEEIDCRISMVKKNGLSLLLYKDARCDQNILDETVGPMNWQKFYSRENANCTVSIWDKDKNMWISKEDTGTESNTEREKGLASDSFKRACFNWGIGRELYTAPFIWIDASQCKIVEKGNGFSCYDKFTVSEIGYDDAGRINSLEIKKGAVIVYSLGSPVIKAAKISTVKKNALNNFLLENGISPEYICGCCKVQKLEDITEAQHVWIHGNIEAIKEEHEKWKAKAGSQT